MTKWIFEAIEGMCRAVTYLLILFMGSVIDGTEASLPVW
jgi:hypothetical protein